MPSAHSVNSSMLQNSGLIKLHLLLSKHFRLSIDAQLPTVRKFGNIIPLSDSVRRSGQNSNCYPCLGGPTNMSPDLSPKLVHHTGLGSLPQPGDACVQAQLLLKRSWRQISRDRATIMARTIANVSAALIFGSIFNRMKLSQTAIQDRLGLLQVPITSALHSPYRFVHECQDLSAVWYQFGTMHQIG